MMNIRTLALIARAQLASAAGLTFDGKRNVHRALGYKDVLTCQDYRARFNRNAVAARIVEAKPQDTWRGGAEVVEDLDAEKVTTFEAEMDALNKRLKVWPVLQRADILAGLGRYAVIVLGAPGAMDTPLTTCTPENLKYLMAFSEADAPIQAVDEDPLSSRYALPTFYELRRAAVSAIRGNVTGKRVHHSRIVHIADGLLDDLTYGTPRLERCWNLLDDLEKVTGGGAEAFWKRADQGKQYDLDPTMELSAEEQQRMQDAVEEFDHGLKRTIRTRGMKINSLGSDVADIKGPSEAILAQICAGVEIPQRVLMGSEQAKLAAEQDSVKYFRMIESRRANVAGPQMARPFVDRMIELGVVSKPTEYTVLWSQIRTLDDEDRATLATKWAQLKVGDQPVVTVNEVRTKCLGIEPMEASELPAPEAPKPGPDGVPETDPLKGKPPASEDPKVRSGKGAPAWKKIHQVADTFRTADGETPEEGIRRRKKDYRPARA